MSALDGQQLKPRIRVHSWLSLIRSLRSKLRAACAASRGTCPRRRTHRFRRFPCSISEPDSAGATVRRLDIHCFTVSVASHSQPKREIQPPARQSDRPRKTFEKVRRRHRLPRRAPSKMQIAGSLKTMIEIFPHSTNLSTMSRTSHSSPRSRKSGSSKAKHERESPDRLLDGLSRVMKLADVGHWLKTPNPAFDGSTPLQVVERGEIDRIWRMLYELESGQPG
jgi:hypothetical protein